MLSSLLETFNLQLGTWAMLIFLAWYLFKGARAGKKVGSVLGRVVMHSIAILVSFGIAAALGYANIFPGQFLADLVGLIGWILEEGIKILWNAVQGLL